MTDYSDALKAAGAEVLAYETFGSYQGDWFAFVEYEGQRFWISDYYGSCSGCDALEADMGWEPYEHDGPDAKADWDRRLAEFGKGYLEPSERKTLEQMRATAAENISWDSDAQEMLDWLESQARKFETP